MQIKHGTNYFLAIAFIVFIIDQVTKAIVRRNMFPGEEIPILKFLSLTFTTNTGAGFSILQGNNHILVWIGIIAAGIILYFLDQFEDSELIFMGLIFGGILGNMA